MIDAQLRGHIRRLFFAEHWKITTIADQLGLHHQTVQRALETERFNRCKIVRPRVTDPYVEFIRQTLEQYPRLRATRGYTGSVVTLRRLVATLRPRPREAFLRLRTFVGEQGQVDWASFGTVQIGGATRGHVRAFSQWGGCPRVLLYDNLKSVVLERRGDAIRFHPRLLELSAHYHFAPRPCHVGRGNEKGRVERAIQYVRSSFFAARPFTTLADFNRQARRWRDEIAHRRPWPGDRSRTVAAVFEEEKAQLLPLPAHPLETDLVMPAKSHKTIYVRFDLNDYSIPPSAVGRQLTLVASDTLVRILDGTAEVARHRRSYDRHQVVADPAHQQALLEQKRKASSAPSDRLSVAVPRKRGLSAGRPAAR